MNLTFDYICDLVLEDFETSAEDNFLEKLNPEEIQAYNNTVQILSKTQRPIGIEELYKKLSTEVKQLFTPDDYISSIIEPGKDDGVFDFNEIDQTIFLPDDINIDEIDLEEPPTIEDDDFESVDDDNDKDDSPSFDDEEFDELADLFDED
jgi:hypothetical protein